MPIRDTTVIAIEGPQGSGKTTLVHGAVGSFRARGLDACDVPESARSSPFFESALLYNGPPIDHWAELHALGDQIASELARARVSELLVTDRTVLNVVSYWQVRFPGRADRIYTSARSFLLEYCRAVYDVIFLLSDRYVNSIDELRETDLRFRQDVERQLERDLSELGSRVVRVPEGLDPTAKLDFLMKEMEVRGLKTCDVASRDGFSDGSSGHS